VIIFRYLTKEIILTTLGILLIFLVIFLSTQLAIFLNQMATGQLDTGVLLQIVGILTISLLSLLLPMSFFVGILMSYGRLYAESEMTALFACGMTRYRLLVYTLILGLFMTVIAGYLSFVIAPLMEVYKAKLIVKTAEQDITRTIIPGRFQATNGGQKVFYVGGVSRDKVHLENIFFAEAGGLQGNFLQGSQVDAPSQGSNDNWSIVLAKKGLQEDKVDMGGRFLVVQDGVRYIGAAGQKDLLLMQYDTYGVRLPKVETAADSPGKIQQWTTKDLIKAYYTNIHAAAELQWRMAIPLQIFILALLAVPLSRTAPRQGRYVPLFPAIVIYSLYANGLFLARDLIDKGVLSISIGLWGVHLILILLAGYLYLGQPGWDPRSKFSPYWKANS
jgi:lipopolysaccharide export system permease protein